MLQLRPRSVPFLFSAALALAAPAGAATWIVREGESIQAAVDAAQPGDRILVRPGVYTGDPGLDWVVNVQKDDLTLIGSRNAVIDASGREYGVLVGPDVPVDATLGCPPIAVRNFTIRGFTFRNASDTGVKLTGVENYQMLRGRYLDNAEYGPFPICSRNGVIAHNTASGHADAAIYIGDSQGALIFRNRVENSAIGIEVENSSDIVVSHNVTRGNTAGILVVVLPDLPFPFTENVVITRNRVLDNNLPNPGSGFVSLLPVGTGILNVGGDNLLIERNVIRGNDSAGLASIGNFFGLLFGDPRIEPFVDNYTARKNRITGNGLSPDPVNAITPGADIVHVFDVVDPFTAAVLLADPDPSDVCFEDNDFDTDFPAGVVDSHPCL